MLSKGMILGDGTWTGLGSSITDAGEEEVAKDPDVRWSG
jgi:hypothetical protein